MEVAVVADGIEIIANIYSTSSECWKDQFYHHVTNLHNNSGGGGHNCHRFIDVKAERLREEKKVAQVQIPCKWPSW